MNEVFKKTRELGEAIMQSDEYKHMKAVEEKAMANAEAALTMGQFLEKRRQVESLLQQDDLDSEILKRLSDEMDDLQERLQIIDDMQELTEARNAFSALIDQVNNVLRFIVTGDMSAQEDGGCSGSCAGCSGCEHTLH